MIEGAPPTFARNGDPSRAFRERARREANRYGADPWVFVRELLQNARDAGASRCQIEVSEGAERVQLRCLDDGEGMSFDHARRYLFSLYSSSKEDDVAQVGKFGVGFWSILRFDPEEIVVRSRTPDGEAWGLRLSGDLSTATTADPPPGVGTEIVLTRSGGDGMMSRRVRDAAHQNGRYLCRRDDEAAALLVTVNGETINEPFELPAPRASFQRRGMKGVVALGSAPRVELFSRGLRVRSAAALEDLLSSDAHTDRSRVAFPDIPGGMAPQAILECPELELLLSRGDARDDRKLRKLVRTAQAELERLVDQQLSRVRDDGWWRRLRDGVAHRLRHSVPWQTAAAITAGVPLALGLAALQRPDPGVSPETTTSAVMAADPGSTADNTPAPYSDLAQRYGGPQVDTLDAAPAKFDLQYSPARERPHFAALRFDHFASDGSPLPRPLRVTGPYETVLCRFRCVAVSLRVGGKGPTRIPVPTGYRVVTGSAHLDGDPVLLTNGQDGLPVLELAADSIGTLTYVVGPARESTLAEASPATLPLPWARAVRAARDLPVSERVQRLRQVLAEDIDYDRSPTTAARHERARARGVGLLERADIIGAGDCDIQNASLAVVLQAAGVPARLAIGMVGSAGVTSRWLHAWVEYQDDDGYWQVADVSTDERNVRRPGSEGPLAVASPLIQSETPPGSPPAVVADEPGETRPLEPENRSWWPLLALGLLGMAGAGVTLTSRTRRSVLLDDDSDLSALLEGALQHPGAFRRLPGLYTRPLIATVGGRRVSLQRARRLASRGQLYVSGRRSPRASRAARRGAAVLDGDRPEATTVAQAMGAVDLDRWDQLIARSSTSPVLDDLNRELRRLGERWCVRRAAAPPGGIASLDVGRLGARVREDGATRVTLIDSLDPVLREAEGQHGGRPATAAFMVLDRILDRMRTSPQRRAEMLSELAAAAVREEAGR